MLIRNNLQLWLGLIVFLDDVNQR
uniref:Uncharacterized protein n=1 Tax=Arundo donax TaxID=35708 RepID=A0A0A8YAN4_ARUDO